MSKYFSQWLASFAIVGALCAPHAFAAESYADSRARIENLIAQYLWAFDTQDQDAFASLFATDGEVVMTGAEIEQPIVFRGPEQLRAFVEMIRKRTAMPAHAELQFSPNIHLTANLVLTVNGDKASSKLYWFTVRRGANVDQITLPNPNPSFFASVGRYEQEYVKQNGKWLFKRVTIAEMGKAPAVATATTTEQPVFVGQEFHADWANDEAYIDKLVRDANPRYEANKRLVLDFEAALERAQTVKDGEPGNFEEVVLKYLTADYVQYDPIFPPGRDGLLGFFKMVQQSGQKVSHPPVMVVAQGDMVVLTMMRPPVPEPDDASKTYTAYRIAIWKVCGDKLCAHWGPDLKETR